MDNINHMDKWNYENANTANFLVYTLGADESIDTVALGMLQNNKIDGFLPMIYLQNNEEKYFKYNITSKISLKMFFEETVNKNRFLNVVSSICKAFEMCGEYMICEGSLILDTEHIFVDVSSARAELVCLPVLNGSTTGTGSINVVSFFKLLLMSTQFDPTENCDYIAKLLNRLNSSDKMSFVEIRALAEELLGNVQNNDENNGEKPVISKPVENIPNAQPVQSLSPMGNIQNVQNVNNVQMTSAPAGTNIPNVPMSANNIPAANIANKQNSINNMSNSNIPSPVINNDEKSSHKGGIFGGLMKSGKKSKEKKPKKAKNASQTAVPQAMAIPGVKVSAGPLTAQPPVQTLQNSPAPQPMQSSPAGAPISSVQPGVTFSRVPVSGVAQAAPQQAMTTVLNKDMLSAGCTPKLYRYKTNELIEISKVPFRIGKEANYVDYFISDNTAVSRSHANIVKRGNDYYIVDTNSTNHTYVNGAMIQSNVEIKLEENTRIKLANEEFEFRFF